MLAHEAVELDFPKDDFCLAMQMHLAMKDALLAEALLIWDSLLKMSVRSGL